MSGVSRTDFSDSIEKIRFHGEIELKNETGLSADVLITTKFTRSERLCHYLIKTIEANGKIFLKMESNEVLKNVEFLDERDQRFINIAKYIRETAPKLTLMVEDVERNPLIQEMKPFDFAGPYFKGTNANDYYQFPPNLGSTNSYKFDRTDPIPGQYYSGVVNAPALGGYLNFYGGVVNAPALGQYPQFTSIYDLTRQFEQLSARNEVPFQLSPLNLGQMTPYEMKKLEEQFHTFKEQNNYLKNYVFPQEGGISMEAFFAHRNRLYESNRFIPSRAVNRIDNRAEGRIPRRDYKMWVTNPKAPGDIPDKYFDFALSSAEKNPNWEHWFIVDKQEYYQEGLKRLEGSKVETKTVAELFPQGMIAQKEYDYSIEEGMLAQSTDILRLEVLYEFGGFYGDTDFELFHRLGLDALLYDMILSVEPMSSYIGNAAMGFRPRHPVVKKALELMKRNLAVPKEMRIGISEIRSIISHSQPFASIFSEIEAFATQNLTRGDKKQFVKLLQYLKRNMHMENRRGFYMDRAVDLLREKGVESSFVKDKFNALEEAFKKSSEIDLQLGIIYKYERQFEKIWQSDTQIQTYVNGLVDILGGYANYEFAQIVEAIKNGYFQPRLEWYINAAVKSFEENYPDRALEAKELLTRLKDSLHNHPIAQEIRDKESRGEIEIDKRPEYIRNAVDEAANVIMTTGPGVMTLAALEAGKNPEDMDIILPPNRFYPGKRNNVYPYPLIMEENDINKPDDHCGTHYWNSVWVTNENGFG